MMSLFEESPTYLRATKIPEGKIVHVVMGVTSHNDLRAFIESFSERIKIDNIILKNPQLVPCDDVGIQCVLKRTGLPCIVDYSRDFVLVSDKEAPCPA